MKKNWTYIMDNKPIEYFAGVPNGLNEYVALFDDGFRFLNETGEEAYGPYKTSEEAMEGLRGYCIVSLSEDEDIDPDEMTYDREPELNSER